MGLTLGLTFIVFLFRCLRYGFDALVELVETSRYFPALLVAVDDAATGQVVWAQFYDHAVLRKDSDVVLTHLPRDVGKYSVSVGQLNAKHCVGQSFDHCAFDLDDTVFFGHCLFVAISDYWSCVDLCQLTQRAIRHLFCVSRTCVCDGEPTAVDMQIAGATHQGSSL